MSRLAQLGIFTLVLGIIVLFLAMFPSAVDADNAPGIGLMQIVAMLVGMHLIVLGGYVTAHALLHTVGKSRTLIQDIGVRMGLTGVVLASAATLADAIGFGSHITGSGPIFGWLQALGMLIGFLFASAGVLLYGSSQ